jgi:hypothetical protein
MMVSPKVSLALGSSNRPSNPDFASWLIRVMSIGGGRSGFLVAQDVGEWRAQARLKHQRSAIWRQGNSVICQSRDHVGKGMRDHDRNARWCGHGNEGAEVSEGRRCGRSRDRGARETQKQDGVRVIPIIQWNVSNPPPRKNGSHFSIQWPDSCRMWRLLNIYISFTHSSFIACDLPLFSCTTTRHSYHYGSRNSFRVLHVRKRQLHDRRTAQQGAVLLLQPLPEQCRGSIPDSMHPSHDPQPLSARLN